MDRNLKFDNLIPSFYLHYNHHMTMSIRVEDIMQKQIISIDSSLSIQDAAKMMTDSEIGCLVVIDKNNPAGILTERDFVTKVAALETSRDKPARNIMSTPLISITSKETVEKLANLMKEKKIHKVPVVDGGRLVGIVTATDVIRKCVVDSDSEMKQICRSFAQMAF